MNSTNVSPGWRQQRNPTQVGATLVGFSIIALVILALGAVIMDFSTLYWAKSSLRYSLYQALKNVESDPAYLTRTGQKVYAFRVTQELALHKALQTLPEYHALLPAISLEPISTTGSLVAYLPPGSGEISSRLVNDDGGARVLANSAYAAKPDDSVDLRQLQRDYPTELFAHARVKTLLFGTRKIDVRVSVFPKLAPFVVPPPPTPVCAKWDLSRSTSPSYSGTLEIWGRTRGGSEALKELNATVPSKVAGLAPTEFCLPGTLEPLEWKAASDPSIGAGEGVAHFTEVGACSDSACQSEGTQPNECIPLGCCSFDDDTHMLMPDRGDSATDNTYIMCNVLNFWPVTDDKWKDYERNPISRTPSTNAEVAMGLARKSCAQATGSSSLVKVTDANAYCAGSSAIFYYRCTGQDTISCEKTY